MRQMTRVVDIKGCTITRMKRHIKPTDISAEDYLQKRKFTENIKNRNAKHSGT